MFTSALTKNQVISFILSVMVGLFLILAGFPPVTELLGRFLPQVMVDGVAAVSFMSHYDALQRGLIDIRDLVYFGSVIGFMLFSTQLVLQNRSAR
jgi:ABC-2 type transport system permease protein